MFPVTSEHLLCPNTIEFAYLGCETVFVGITTDTGDTLNSEVKWLQLVLSIESISQSGPFEVRHDEGSEATINVEAQSVSSGEFSETNDIILITIWEIHGRTNELK